MFENIRADIGRKVRGYGVRPQDKTFFRKRITPLLEFGTAGSDRVSFRSLGLQYQNSRVIRQIADFIYLVVNTVCLHASPASISSARATSDPGWLSTIAVAFSS